MADPQSSAESNEDPVRRNTPESNDKANAMECWGKLSQEVETKDMKKIQRIKDDMDIVLTFTGLFSAVLTAFLAASLPELQEDTAKTSAQLLRLLVLQNSAETTSTRLSDVQNPLPFSPPVSLLFVNVIWFTSLSITLFTASFGFLVKQWLGEYLDIDNNNPLARLRIRQFRYQGLIRYRVFEIASSLPLLLQCALALFYTGLCVYTLSIHISIGWTCIPLAIIWASLFTIATVFPLFSSMCPYRTTLLPESFKKLRMFILKRPRIITMRWYELQRLFTKTTDGQFVEYDEDPSVPLEEDQIALSKRADLQILYSDDVVRLHDVASDAAQLACILQEKLPPESIFRFFLKVIDYHLPPLPSDAQTMKTPSGCFSLSARWLHTLFRRSQRPVGARSSKLQPSEVNAAALVNIDSDDEGHSSDENDKRSVKDPAPIDYRRLLDLQPLSQAVSNGFLQSTISFVKKYHQNGEYVDDPKNPYMRRAIFVLFAKIHDQPSSSEMTRNLRSLRETVLQPTDENATFRTHVCRILAKADFPRVWSVIDEATRSYKTSDRSKIVVEILKCRRDVASKAALERVNLTSDGHRSSAAQHVGDPPPQAAVPRPASLDRYTPQLDFTTVMEYVSKQRDLPGSELGGIQFILEAELNAHIAELRSTAYTNDSWVNSLQGTLLMAHAKYGKVANAAFNAVFDLLGHEDWRTIFPNLSLRITQDILKVLSRDLYPEDRFTKAKPEAQRRFLQSLEQLLKTNFLCNTDTTSSTPGNTPNAQPNSSLNLDVEHSVTPQSASPNVDPIRLTQRLLWILKASPGNAVAYASQWERLLEVLDGPLDRYIKCACHQARHMVLNPDLPPTFNKRIRDALLNIGRLYVLLDCQDVIKEARDMMKLNAEDDRDAQRPQSAVQSSPARKLAEILNRHYDLVDKAIMSGAIPTQPMASSSPVYARPEVGFFRALMGTARNPFTGRRRASKATTSNIERPNSPV